jgi:hypothetical protein
MLPPSIGEEGKEGKEREEREEGKEREKVQEGQGISYIVIYPYSLSL